jgi:protease IV
MSEKKDEVGAKPAEGAQTDLAIVAFSKLFATMELIVRRDLRWRNIRAAMITVGVVLASVTYSAGLRAIIEPKAMTEPYAAMVRVEGSIDSDGKASAHKLNQSLRSAFEDEKAKAVILLVNSPGGSPVQSSLVHDRILELKKQHPDKKVYAVGEDYIASGAYFIASAADSICVNRSTIAGSIGVIMSGWGLDKTIGRFDVERRVTTAGTNKNRMDMFKPWKEEDKEKAAILLKSMHAHFVDAVKEGRGDRLKGPPEVLFSGDYWTGDEAVKLGIADKLCDLSSVMETDIGVKQVKDFSVPPSLFASLTNQFGAEVTKLVTEEINVKPEMVAY